MSAVFIYNIHPKIIVITVVVIITIINNNIANMNNLSEAYLKKVNEEIC